MRPPNLSDLFHSPDCDRMSTLQNSAISVRDRCICGDWVRTSQVKAHFESILHPCSISLPLRIYRNVTAAMSPRFQNSGCQKLAKAQYQVFAIDRSKIAMG